LSGREFLRCQTSAWLRVTSYEPNR
jgi:hypothetical protein